MSASPTTLVEEVLKQQGGKSNPNIVTDTVRQFLTVEGVDDLDIKTRIDDPDGMGFFEETKLFFADDKEQRKLLGLKGKRHMTDTDFMTYGARRKRINEIPRGNGEARQEAVQVVAGATLAQEKSTKERALEGFGWNK